MRRTGFRTPIGPRPERARVGYEMASSREPGWAARRAQGTLHGGAFVVSPAQRPEDRDAVHFVLLGGYEEVRRDVNARRQEHLDRATFTTILGHEDGGDERRSLWLLARDRLGAPTACVRITWDDGQRLPLERELRIDLGSMRRLVGRIAEVGRLAVQTPGRADPLLLRAILRGVVQECMARDVSFLVLQALSSAAALYRKLGFIDFNDSDRAMMDREFGLPCYPQYLNLAHFVRRTLLQRAASAQPERLATARRAYQRYCTRICRNSPLAKTLVDQQRLPSAIFGGER